MNGDLWDTYQTCLGGRDNCWNVKTGSGASRRSRFCQPALDELHQLHNGDHQHRQGQGDTVLRPADGG